MKKILTAAILVALSGSAHAWTSAGGIAGSGFMGQINNSVTTYAESNGNGSAYQGATAGASLDARGYAGVNARRCGQNASGVGFSAGVADEKHVYTSVYGERSGNASGYATADANATGHGHAAAGGYSVTIPTPVVDPFAAAGAIGTIDNSATSHSDNANNGEAWNASGSSASLDIEGYAKTNATHYRVGIADRKSANSYSNGFQDGANSFGSAHGDVAAIGGAVGFAADSDFTRSRFQPGVNNFLQFSSTNQ